MTSHNPAAEIYPALIVYRCPLGCGRPCARIWINETIGHSIICECLCGHDKKQTVLDMVGGNRESNTSAESSFLEDPR